jgi:hypothetical protein
LNQNNADSGIPSRFKLDAARSSVLIRLLLAVNDIALAADANDVWAETTDSPRAHLKGRRRMYFMRLIMSHVHEALKIIDEIYKSPDLTAVVDQFDAHTRENFKKLIAILRSPFA